MVWHGGDAQWICAELGTLFFRKFLKTYGRPLVQVMGAWPLGTHATGVKKSEGCFFIFLRIDSVRLLLLVPRFFSGMR